MSIGVSGLLKEAFMLVNYAKGTKNWNLPLQATPNCLQIENIKCLQINAIGLNSQANGN